RLVLSHQYRYCFCPDCLRTFEERSGIRIPASLTDTAQISAWILKYYDSEWAEFRASVITGLVRSIRRKIQSLNPSFKLSAAIWYNAPYGNELMHESFRPDSEFEYFGQKWW